MAQAAGTRQSAEQRRVTVLEAALVEFAERGLRETLDSFQRASAGLEGEDALRAMGAAYEQLLDDRTMLRAQLQAYAACDDPEIRKGVRRGFGEIMAHVERASGASPEEIARWFATGMLLNVAAAMDLQHAREPWAQRLLAGLLPAE